MSYTKEDIKKSLQELGLKEGDICVVKSSLREIGEIEGKRSSVVLDALLETLGKEGTIITLTFTNLYSLPIDPNNPKYVFTKDTPPYTGGLSKECLLRHNAVRSQHPSTSMCAIGKEAHSLLEGHDANRSSYKPIAKAIEKNGKMLLIGGLFTVPGTITVHWAQWLLGLATQSRSKTKYGIYYQDDDGQIKLYIRKDFGGCNKGHHKFYEHYRRAGILSEGKIGNAPSMLIALKEALEIEMPLIEKDPRYALCDDPSCMQCRIGWEYSDTSPLIFWLKNPKTLLYALRRRLKD